MENENNSVIFHDLLDYDLCRMCSAEMQLKNSIDSWINHTYSSNLKDILLKYMNVTQRNLTRIKLFIETEEIHLLSLSNPLMRTWIEETDRKVANCKHNDIRDICLLENVAAINDFKLSTFRSAAKIAGMLELQRVNEFFTELRENESEINVLMARLTKHEIHEHIVR